MVIESAPDFETQDLLINVGPQHPSTHGVFRMILEVDGEMQGDAALSQELREKLVSGSSLKGSANLLVMPSLDSANISYNLVRMLADGLAVGPMLIGMQQPAHILAEGVTARGITNMTAVAVVEAQNNADGELPFEKRD